MSTEAKHICPNCGYEYESWVEVCPDCDTPIETLSERPDGELARPQLRPDEDPEWTVVTNVPNAMLGNLIKNQLEDAGIPVLIQRTLGAFTHSDYVPHDIRVPRHLVSRARELVESTPGYFDSATVEDDDRYEVEEEEPDRSNWYWRAPSGTGLPEGFTMLPTEDDVRVLQSMRRTHSDTPPDWEWEDGYGTEAERDTPEEEESANYQKNFGAVYSRRERSEREYDEYDYEESWSGPSKWLRIVYGILIAIMSLPFLLQLLQQLWQILGGR